MCGQGSRFILPAITRVHEGEAQFVGRDQELRLLKEAPHATGRERRPRLVSVMGTGGPEKSRLAWEFVK